MTSNQSSAAHTNDNVKPEQWRLPLINPLIIDQRAPRHAAADRVNLLKTLACVTDRTYPVGHWSLGH